MTTPSRSLDELLDRSPVRVLFEPGVLAKLGSTAADEGARRVLLVTDPGIVAAGHVERALQSLTEAGLHVTVFDGVQENPSTEHVAAGLRSASTASIDFIVGLGGGSAMDCAKGVNLLLTNGGRVVDYWGINKPTEPMLPMIAVPTTAGTGSEAQSFALITDPNTHQKMACGDRRLPTQGGLRPRVAILDAELTLSQPTIVAAAAGIDAVAHAVETSATSERNDTSRAFSLRAWKMLEKSYEKIMMSPNDLDARGDMLMGAHLAGAAIECSMLGAAHACANPLTARCSMTHGQAVGLMLPHVIRFNADHGTNPYADLCKDAEVLARAIESLLDAGNLTSKLRDCDVREGLLPELADMAAQQWTAKFNPRKVSASDLLALYQAAW